MPKRKPVTHVTDPVRAKVMHETGTGFYAPFPPSREGVVAYLRLYNETRPGWDQPPELGVLRAPYADTVTGYPLPIPEGTWAAFNDPMRVIRKLADLLWEQGRTDHALLRNIDRPMLADMVGVYFMHEGWAPPRGKELQAVQTMQAGMRYRISETADRRETRAVLAVQVDGVVHSTTLYRDSPRDVHHMSWDPNDPAQTNDGIGGTMVRPLLEVAYGLIKTLRPEYANQPDEERP